jgi:hypothetical protein
MIRIIVEWKGCAKRKGAKGKVKTRFKDGPNRGVKIANELMEEEAVREETTRENGVVNVATPSRDIVGKGHIGFLTGFKRKRRTVIKQGVGASMDSKLIEEPVSISAFANQTSEKGMRGIETRNLVLKTGNNKVGKGSLDLDLKMAWKERKPNTERVVVTKSMERRNIATIVLTMKYNTIPPRGKITESISSKGRKELLELLLLLQVKPTIGQIGKEEGTIHVDSVGANRVMDKNTMIGPRCNPRNNGASDSIHNHVSGIMDITLKILPSGTLTIGRKRGAFGK